METQTFTFSMYSDLSGFGLWKSNLGLSTKNNLSECEFFRKSLFSIVSLYTRYCRRTTGWNLEGLKRRCLCCLWPIIQFNNISVLKGWIFPTLLLIIQSLNSLWISKHLGTGKWKIMSVFFDFDNVLKAGLFCIWKLWHQTVTLIVLQEMG